MARLYNVIYKALLTGFDMTIATRVFPRIGLGAIAEILCSEM